jgi:hypothetical protein
MIYRTDSYSKLYDYRTDSYSKLYDYRTDSYSQGNACLAGGETTVNADNI